MTNMEDEDRTEEDSQGIIPTHILPPSNDNCNFTQTTNPMPAEDNSRVTLCAGCQKPILDKFFMMVDKRYWHESCLQCDVCQRPLIQSCYAKNHRLYCQQDYKQLQKCRRCLRFISFNEYVLHVGGMPYHVKCFICDFCHRQLQSGDQYLVDESTNRIYCKSCYAHGGDPMRSHYIQDENSVSDSERSDDDVFPHQNMIGLSHMAGYVPTTGVPPHHGLLRSKNGAKSASSLSLLATSSDGKRVKRPRTILTTAQRRKFKASFEVSQKPCRKVRETLAAETGLSPRVVQVWFQNQRAKMKKLARRQQGDGSSQGGSRSASRNRRKKATDSESDNEVLSSSGSYVSIPTPHQNVLFPDGYRSPANIPISPTTSSSEINPFFQQPPSSNHDLSDVMYDDFESNILTSGDAFMTQTQHTVTSSTNAASLSTEVRLHASVNQSIGDFHGPRINMGLDGDSLTVTSPHHDLHPFNPSQAIMHFPTQTQDGNPIDRLMYMQNNFFRT